MKLLWRGFRGGYGRQRIEGKNHMTHRRAWELANGPIPPGLNVNHHCDNPPCVNPAHLYVGTHAQNAADRNARGRTSRGARHAASFRPLAGMAARNSVLTDEQVRQLRNGYSGAFGEQAQWARRLGVHPSVISKVLSGSGWRHVR